MRMRRIFGDLAKKTDQVQKGKMRRQNSYRPENEFRPEFSGTSEMGQNGAKFNPRWNGGCYHSVLHTGTRYSGHSSWNGTESITLVQTNNRYWAG